MATFKTNCSFCNVELEADKEQSGMEATCPECGNKINLSNPQATPDESVRKQPLRIKKKPEEENKANAVARPIVLADNAYKYSIDSSGSSSESKVGGVQIGKVVFCLIGLALCASFTFGIVIGLIITGVVALIGILAQLARLSNK